jgi:glutathione S-transferase
MKLYYFETMNPRKVCALAKYLGSPVEYIRTDLGQGAHKAPDYLARNPNGLVPLLVDNGRSIWESAAIMVHLAHKSGSEMWPARDPDKLVEVVKWLSWNNAHWTGVTGPFYFEHIIKAMFGMGEPDVAMLEKKERDFHRFAKVLEHQLATRRFLAGDSMTIADFATAVLLPYADQIKLPIADYRSIQRWHGELMQLDAWRNPWPAQPAGA